MASGPDQWRGSDDGLKGTNTQVALPDRLIGLAILFSGVDSWFTPDRRITGATEGQGGPTRIGGHPAMGSPNDS
jgi:hypothetical protein